MWELSPPSVECQDEESVFVWPASRNGEPQGENGINPTIFYVDVDVLCDVVVFKDWWCVLFCDFRRLL